MFHCRICLRTSTKSLGSWLRKKNALKFRKATRRKASGRKQKESIGKNDEPKMDGRTNDLACQTIWWKSKGSTKMLLIHWKWCVEVVKFSKYHGKILEISPESKGCNHLWTRSKARVFQNANSLWKEDPQITSQTFIWIHLKQIFSKISQQLITWIYKLQHLSVY